MSVKPEQLSFTGSYQKATYSVEFTPVSEGDPEREDVEYSQGSITWISGTNTVRIPIAVIFK